MKPGSDTERAHQMRHGVRCRLRRKVIKDRQAFPRFGWPAIYPPEKDPLAPRQFPAVRAAAAEASALPAPFSPGFDL